MNHGTPFQSKMFHKGRRGRHPSIQFRWIIVAFLWVSVAISWLLVETGPSSELDEDKHMLKKVVVWLTGVDFDQPRSLLTGQIPSITYRSDQEAELAYDDGQGRYVDPPIESQPPLEWILQENETPLLAINGQAMEWTEIKADSTSNNQEAMAQEFDSKTVFIYHTHNRESYLPWLKGVESPNRAYDEKNNITVAGKKLGEELEARGVGTIVSTTDYAKIIPSYAKSYAYSLKTLKNNLNRYKQMQYVFDLHRDSQPRKKTTVMINGKTYAQIYIIIGKQNPNWNQNYELGVRFHKKMEEQFPGLSKSVYTKKVGNGDYNQSAFPNSILIEVGGVGNTKEEVFRTIEAMADVVSDMVYESNLEPATVVQRTEEDGNK